LFLLLLHLHLLLLLHLPLLRLLLLSALPRVVLNLRDSVVFMFNPCAVAAACGGKRPRASRSTCR
jgi:hypothetical protein